jgi:hypothetical protein
MTQPSAGVREHKRTDATQPVLKRSYERVLDKLAEATFFLHQIERCWRPDESAYLYSAFATACRSVTFTLQAVCAEIAGFEPWYQDQRTALSKHPESRFLLDARNETQKLGLNLVVRHGHVSTRLPSGRHSCRPVLHFRPLDAGGSVPSGDAVTCGREHLRRLARVVAACHRQFRSVLDPTRKFAPDIKALTYIPDPRPRLCPIDRHMRFIEPYRMRLIRRRKAALRRGKALPVPQRKYPTRETLYSNDVPSRKMLRDLRAALAAWESVVQPRSKATRVPPSPGAMKRARKTRQ